MKTTYIIQSFINFILSLFSPKPSSPPHKALEELPPLLRELQKLGFQVNSSGDYDLNIIGIRTSTVQPNKFDDHLYCIYKVDNKWTQHRWNITTDPGLYWLHNPMNDLGTALVVAGRQYKDVWQLGKHRGRYKALVQTGNKIAVYRDANRDDEHTFDSATIEEGYFGINCHRATTAKGGSVNVNKWSAGCQVFQNPNDFKKFIALCVKQREREHTKFTYTLLNEWCIMEELEWDSERSKELG